MAEELRSSAWRCLRAATDLDAAQKFALLRHFLHAFSRLGDLESQLVLRYEIICLCEAARGTSDLEMMKVDLNEWISFAEDCLSAGFLSNASKAYEKAITRIQGCQPANSEQAHALHRLSTRLQHRILPDITDEIEVQNCNSNSSDLQHERSSRTAVSTFMAGIRKKENAKLQMLRGRNK